MSGVTRVAAFLVVLAVVFGAALVIGRYAGPDDAASTSHDDGHASDDGHDAHDDSAGQAEDDYRLELAEDSFEAGTRQVAFSVTRAGQPVTDYDVVHEKRLHLIAVREDLEGYQHVHPELDGDGTWTVGLDLRPGAWWLYADAQPQGAQAMTLTDSVVVDGEGTGAEPAHGVRRTSSVDGYRVTLDGDLAAGGASTLTPRVTRDGVDVTDELQPYLGARGHLVALRHDDLAYLHVHPEGLDFHTDVPRAGSYELFLDFKHEGVVRTARFTLATDSPATEGGGATTDEDHHDH